MSTEKLDDEKNELIWNVKRDAKRLMEEAVTKKFVHADSSTVIALCVTVELCIAHRLKRRIGGLLSSSSESVIPRLARFDDVAKKLETDCNAVADAGVIGNGPQAISPFKVNGFNVSGTQSKYLWIKLALLSKTLSKVIGALVVKWREFYEPDALIADQVFGPTLVWLLDGPCSLEYSKMRTPDDIWNDPTANELVQRHRIYGTNGTTPKAASHARRKLLTPTKSNPDSLARTNVLAREHVDSLHQNSHSSLIFGKNNVSLNLPEYAEPLLGYLAVHKNSSSLLLKWTPNAMMSSSTETEKSQFWDQVLTVDLLNVVFLHCHQSGDLGGSIVLIGQDGIQLPPLGFSPGGSLLLFLSCLEQGLTPFGRLDPPIMSSDASVSFPRLRQSQQDQGKPINDGSGDGSRDYVFRVVAGTGTAAFDKRELHRLLSRNASKPKFKPPWKQPEDRRVPLGPRMHGIKLQRSQIVPARVSLELACEKMKHQIVTRAFCGWLAHCRHLKTVRTHLASLVQPARPGDVLPSNVDGGLTHEMWQRLHTDDKVLNKHRVLQYVYHGGTEHSLRAEVWPYLLGHHVFGESKKECSMRDTKIRLHYQKVLDECRSVEAFLREKEKDLLSLDGFNEGDTFSSLNNSTVDETDAFEPPQEEEEEHENDKSVSVSTPNDTGTASPEAEERLAQERLVHDSTPKSPVRKLTNSESTDSNTTLLNGNDSVITSMLRKKERLRTIVENASRRGSEVWQGLLNKSSESSSRRRSHSARQDTLSVDSYDSFDLEVICHTCGKKIIESKANLSRNSQNRGVGLESIRCFTCLAKERRRFQNRSKTESDASSILETDLVDFSRLAREGKDIIFHEPSFDKGDDYVVIDGVDGKEPSLKRQMSMSAAGSPLTDDFLKDFALNIHRIDKDVLRCDRNYAYYADSNLQKLRNIMVSYVWERLDVGYVQGMCDLCAPILVVLDDEAKAYGCFIKLMDRMGSNFPHGSSMDKRLANISSLIQILDPELFEVLQQHNDHSIFYFCYRWFLLDFKRELLYDDVFLVWETIWASDSVASLQFSLFVALALIELYRDIIVDNRMDFSDIIKFFNEMAERHDASAILDLARNIVHRLQDVMHPNDAKTDDED